MANISYGGGFETSSDGFIVISMFGGTATSLTTGSAYARTGSNGGIASPDDGDQYIIRPLPDMQGRIFTMSIYFRNTSRSFSTGETILEFANVSVYPIIGQDWRGEIVRVGSTSVNVVNEADKNWYNLTLVCDATNVPNPAIILSSALRDYYIDDWTVFSEGKTSTFVNVSGVWKSADKYIKQNGVWKEAETQIRHNGTWKEV
ncbi:hypothetical protein phiOC_p355 [Ochrobactrum phage vB_OspM_OC]|nr:hypothetical protein phiOC_p355 [Ochrobactrum phage vB_OspM_OC]